MGTLYFWISWCHPRWQKFKSEPSGDRKVSDSQGRKVRILKGSNIGLWQNSGCVWRQDLRPQMPYWTKVHHPMSCRLGARNTLAVPALFQVRWRSVSWRWGSWVKQGSSLLRDRNHRPQVRYRKCDPVRFLVLITHSGTWLNLNLLKAYYILRDIALSTKSQSNHKSLRVPRPLWSLQTYIYMK